MSDLVENPEDRFSHIEAPLLLYEYANVMPPIPMSMLFEPRYEETGFCICENKDADQLLPFWGICKGCFLNYSSKLCFKLF